MIIRKPLKTASAIRKALSMGAQTPQRKYGPVYCTISGRLGISPDEKFPVRKVRQGKLAAVKETAFMVFILEGWVVPSTVFMEINSEAEDYEVEQTRSGATRSFLEE